MRGIGVIVGVLAIGLLGIAIIGPIQQIYTGLAIGVVALALYIGE